MARRAIIYIGPSLSLRKAQQLFPEADYRPPAKKGDLLRLAVELGNSGNGSTADVAVGLVDAVFLQDYPPTPIEVYQLVRKPNVIVAGAASLGALRAVELERFGMVGIGKIFQLYKSEKIHADDEVAVTFTDVDYKLESEAMVDIRYNLFLAKKRGAINNQARTALARTAKKIYFPHRNYSHIIEEAARAHPSLASEFEAFSSYIQSKRKSLKELDAIKLVKGMKEFVATGELAQLQK